MVGLRGVKRTVVTEHLDRLWASDGDCREGSVVRSVSMRTLYGCDVTLGGYGYDYESSTEVQHLARVDSIVLHRSTELRTRAGAKEEQICM